MKAAAAALLCWLALPGAAAAELSVALRTSQGAAVADAAVWLEAGATPAAVRPPFEISQRDREFDPFLTVVSVGSRVVFPNHDKVKHHVYSFSAAKSFEIQLYSGTPSEPIVFDKAGVAVLGCNIHDWMLAYVLVVNSPWHAKSQKNGHATLANLPQGSYTLRVWHPHQTAQLPPRTVELGAAASRQALALKLDIAVPVRPARKALDSY